MYRTMCISRIPKQYSIAEARRNLPGLVNEAESGSEVQLTRRGRPVAVVVSVQEYERLKAQRTSFTEAYRAFRTKFPEGTAGIGPKYFRSARERGTGRAVNL